MGSSERARPRPAQGAGPGSVIIGKRPRRRLGASRELVDAPRTRALWWFIAIAELTVFVQVTLGVILVNKYKFRFPKFHAFYGFVAIIAGDHCYSNRYQMRHRVKPPGVASAACSSWASGSGRCSWARPGSARPRAASAPSGYGQRTHGVMDKRTGQVAARPVAGTTERDRMIRSFPSIAPSAEGHPCAVPSFHRHAWRSSCRWP